MSDSEIKEIAYIMRYAYSIFDSREQGCRYVLGKHPGIPFLVLKAMWQAIDTYAT